MSLIAQIQVLVSELTGPAAILLLAESRAGETMNRKDVRVIDACLWV